MERIGLGSVCWIGSVFCGKSAGMSDEDFGLQALCNVAAREEQVVEGERCNGEQLGDRKTNC